MGLDWVGLCGRAGGVVSVERGAEGGKEGRASEKRKLVLRAEGFWQEKAGSLTEQRRPLDFARAPLKGVGRDYDDNSGLAHQKSVRSPCYAEPTVPASCVRASAAGGKGGLGCFWFRVGAAGSFALCCWLAAAVGYHCYCWLALAPAWRMIIYCYYQGDKGTD